MAGAAGRGHRHGWERLISRRDLDEDDVRTRPGKGSRPRTRTRPRHEQAVEALVLAVDRGRYTCLVGDARVTAMRARELGRKSVVVGDRVAVLGDTTGGPDALVRIVRINPRSSVLRRTADDNDPIERVLVANAELMVIVTALADPPPRTGMIDRCLVASYDAGLEPLLCLTKSDLGDAAGLLATYAPLGVAAAVTRRDDDGRSAAQLRDRLTGRISVLVGHSGVGKSTLVNALVPDAGRAVGGVNDVTGRGRHTSSSAVALALPSGGWVIDTPGVRSFGLAHVSPTTIVASFPDLAAAARDCPPGCEHEDGAALCSIAAAVAAGTVEPERLLSLRRLLSARATSDA